MVPAALLVGFVVAPLTAGVVYADARRRDVSPRKRLLWTVGTGAVGLAGFLLPHLYDSAFALFYLREVKPHPVTSAPYEMLLVHIVVGTAVSVATVLVYGFGRRVGRRRLA